MKKITIFILIILAILIITIVLPDLFREVRRNSAEPDDLLTMVIIGEPNYLYTVNKEGELISAKGELKRSSKQIRAIDDIEEPESYEIVHLSEAERKHLIELADQAAESFSSISPDYEIKDAYRITFWYQGNEYHGFLKTKYSSELVDLAHALFDLSPMEFIEKGFA